MPILVQVSRLELFWILGSMSGVADLPLCWDPDRSRLPTYDSLRTPETLDVQYLTTRREFDIVQPMLSCLTRHTLSLTAFLYRFICIRPLACEKYGRRRPACYLRKGYRRSPRAFCARSHSNKPVHQLISFLRVRSKPH